MTTLLREPLYRVEITSRDASMPGKGIVERVATLEHAERAAAKINEQEGPFVAAVKRSRWRLVLPR